MCTQKLSNLAEHYSEKLKLQPLDVYDALRVVWNSENSCNVTPLTPTTVREREREKGVGKGERGRERLEASRSCTQNGFLYCVHTYPVICISRHSRAKSFSGHFLDNALLSACIVILPSCSALVKPSHGWRVGIHEACGMYSGMFGS